MSKKRIIITAFAVVIAGLAAFVYWFTWKGSTKEIVAVADQFKAPSDWQLVTDRVEPPRTICLDSRCPSLHRSSKTNSNLTKQVLQEIVYRSGWKLVVDGDCEARTNTSGAVPVCTAEGLIVNNYQASVTIWKNSVEKTEGRVVLDIEN